eukprot:jgi/Hompol1/314/HPOL_002463-RA
MIDSLFVLDANGSGFGAGFGAAPAIVAIDGFHLLHICRSSLLLVAVTTNEVAPASLFVFLQFIVSVLSSYFGTVSEAVLKENFVIVYELLEELVDYGSPYMTELCLLKEVIPPPSLLSSMINAVSLGTQNGRIIAGTIFGMIVCNCRLSGMPDLVLTLGNKGGIADGMVSLHPCVRASRFERDRVLSFVPPDGKFQLMYYNMPLSNESHLPLIVKPAIRFQNNGGKLEIAIHPKVASDKVIEGLMVYATLPPEITSVRMTTNNGQCSFDQNTKVD